MIFPPKRRIANTARPRPRGASVAARPRSTRGDPRTASQRSTWQAPGSDPGKGWPGAGRGGGYIWDLNGFNETHRMWDLTGIEWELTGLYFFSPSLSGHPAVGVLQKL